MKITTVNISFPRKLLDEIDETAERESRNRSELIREASRMYVERKKHWNGIFAFWRNQADKRGLKPRDAERAIQDYRSSKR